MKEQKINYAYKVMGDWDEWFVLRYNQDKSMFTSSHIVAVFQTKSEAQTYVNIKIGKFEILEPEDTEDMDELKF